MKKFFEKNRRLVYMLLTVLISLILIVSSVTMLKEYSDELEEQAGFKGKLYSEEVATHLARAVRSYEDLIVSEIRSELTSESYDSGAAFAAKLRYIGYEEEYSSLMFSRYFKNGEEFTVNGQSFNTALEDKAVLELSKRSDITCAGVVTDREHSISAVAFCVPLNNIEYADSVALFFQVASVISFPTPLEGEALSNSSLSVVCSEEGEVLAILNQKDMGIVEHNNIYEELRKLINDKDKVGNLQTLASSGESDVDPVTISSSNYIASVSSIKENGANPFSVIALYRSQDIYSSAYFTINTILGALIIFSILMIVVSVTFFIHMSRNERRFKDVVEVNGKLDCPSRSKFESTTAEILSRNKATAFAVIVMDMKHYSYISNQLGGDGVRQILLYLKLLFSKLLQVDETMGYLGDGRFLLLLHYRDDNALAERIKMVSSLAGSYKGALPEGYHLNLFGGIYSTTSGVTDDVSNMIDLALTAKEAVNYPYDFGAFRFYNERIHAGQAQTEYIEVRMESALQNNEFQLFFQPKYDLAKSITEGCEVLVRWYNKEKDTYMQPGVFMPLFEANGFIVKLDKYIYEQVCKYVHDTVEARERVYPMSVNVSRLTAKEPDFLKFVTATKKKYNISDRFLTLEFMESFAFEDFNTFRETVNQLHKNGFRCSIDDFGSGFSSYNILKELPMDEIKLDRLFLNKGLSDERDRKIISSIISIAKELNIKVIQKGVETQEQFDMLKELGCNVAQGYYYSKPLCLSDYIDFVDNTARKGNIFH